MSFRNPFVPATLVLLASLAWACGDGGGGSGAGAPQGPGAEGQRCTVTARYTGTGAVDVADVYIDYTNVDGSFGGAGNHTTCRALPAAVTHSARRNNCDQDCSVGESRWLYLSLATGQSGDGNSVKGPADLFRCAFDGDAATLPGLQVAGVLTDENFDDLCADLALVTQCEDSSSTTTTSTTTTTLCEGPDCASREVSVEVWLDDPMTLGSLQIEMGFACDLGLFKPIGSTPKVQCRFASGASGFFATNQFEQLGGPSCRRRFNFALVSPDGILGPHALVVCTFVVAEGSPDPVAADFSLKVVDASSTDLLHDPDPFPFPAVSVRGFEPIEH